MKDELIRRLIPLGEYQKPRFLFYDCSTSKLYAIDGYNSSSQSLWILGAVLITVPILGRLANNILIHSALIKLLSSLFVVIIAVGSSRFFCNRVLKNREIYQVDEVYYQNSDFYNFAKKNNKLVWEGFVALCVAAVCCLALYFWGGDILFLLFFFLMSLSFIMLIESNNLKRGKAIKQLKNNLYNR